MTPPADAITITFRQPAPLLNMNSREHWAPKGRKVAAWRSTSRDYAAIALRCRKLGPSFVMLTIDVPDKRRRDPANLYATVKPVVDGLVDAGLWPDDTPEYVTTIEPVLRTAPSIRGIGRAPLFVTIHIWPRGEQ